jgi:chromosome segregation ATPase
MPEEKEKTIGIKPGKDETLKADFDKWSAAVSEKFGVARVTNGVALRALLNLAKIEEVKERVPGRAEEINDYRTMLDQLLTRYLSSVDAAALAKTQAEEEVQVELATRTRTIAELQKKLDDLKEQNAKLEQVVDSATAENNRLQVKVKTLNETIADKDALIQSLKNNAAAVDAVGAIVELKELVAKLKKPEPESIKK